MLVVCCADIDQRFESRRFDLSNSAFQAERKEVGPRRVDQRCERRGQPIRTRVLEEPGELHVCDDLHSEPAVEHGSLKTCDLVASTEVVGHLCILSAA